MFETMEFNTDNLLQFNYADNQNLHTEQYANHLHPEQDNFTIPNGSVVLLTGGQIR